MILNPTCVKDMQSILYIVRVSVVADWTVVQTDPSQQNTQIAIVRNNS